MRWHWWLVAALTGETFLLLRYAAFGAQFHYFLHGFVGVAVGLAVLALARAASPRVAASPRATVLGAAVAGRVMAAAPDILFLAADLPHERWMDVFLAHIAVHFMPAPVATAFGLFVIGVAAAGAAVLGRHRAAVVAAVAVLVLLGAGLVVRDPLPATLDDIRAHPEIALSCRLPAAGATVSHQPGRR